MDLIADFFDMRGSCSHRASLLLGRERPADAARGVAAQLPRSPHAAAGSDEQHSRPDMSLPATVRV